MTTVWVPLEWFGKILFSEKMAGKTTKDNVSSALIRLQDGIGLPNGFPLFCFVIGNSEFINDFFHDLDTVVQLSENVDFEQLGVLTGLFSSRGDSKKSGFTGKIPNGWSEITGGKSQNQKFIYILKSA